jgi:hypothetical protein
MLITSVALQMKKIVSSKRQKTLAKTGNNFSNYQLLKRLIRRKRSFGFFRVFLIEKHEKMTLLSAQRSKKRDVRNIPGHSVKVSSLFRDFPTNDPQRKRLPAGLRKKRSL